MLAVEIDLLTGRYSATRHNDRHRPEWPPHPQRLFSALVAIWADADEPDPLEREALEWVETLAAPEIRCSAAFARSAIVSFVPVNDASVARDLSAIYERHLQARSGLEATREAPNLKDLAKAERELAKVEAKIVEDSRKASATGTKESPGTIAEGLRVLPDKRGWQPRSYPTAIPDDPKVVFAWPDVTSRPELVARLDHMLARVHRIGHSSTLVSCRVIESPGEPTLIPDPDGAESLRVPGPGLLAELERAYATHHGSEPRALPTRYATYGAPRPTKVQYRSALAGDWVVLEHLTGRQLPLRRASELASAVLRAIMSHAPEPISELISGHVARSAGADRNGSTRPLQRPHLAVLPLAFAGAPHADGSIYGVALALPAEVDSEDRAQLFEALSRWSASQPGADGLPLAFGSGNRLSLTWRAEPSDRAVLRRTTWCHASRQWATVTPVALDRHPGDLHARNPARRARAEREAIASVVAACKHIDLPDPALVEIDRESFLVGVPSASSFPAFGSGSGPSRALVHVRLRFADPVVGPVVLGAGRYRGMGLTKPLTAGGETRA
ncbi:MAG: type I-G CRISPR-associated protein Csb2 [Acidimicrobiales bacterium]